jgi:hypothetical protein
MIVQIEATVIVLTRPFARTWLRLVWMVVAGQVKTEGKCDFILSGELEEATAIAAKFRPEVDSRFRGV